jgi:error-prone DNA polymerase
MACLGDAMVLPDYAELCAQSNFSFLQGACSPEALVQRAADLGYTALAITDECSVAGVVRAYRQVQSVPLQLIVGTRCQISETPQPWSVVLLARSRVGYGQLCQAITRARARAPKGLYKMLTQDLQPLDDCVAILLSAPASPISALSHAIEVLWPWFGQRLWLGESALLHASQTPIRQELKALSDQYRVPRVAVGQVLMAQRADKPLQDVLTAIRLGRPIDQCGHALAPNAEQHLRTRLRLAQLYEPSLLEATQTIAGQCSFDLGSLRYDYPTEIVPKQHTPSSYLREQTWLGAQRRYRLGVPPEVTQQLEHELNLIDELNYPSYFLTVYDIVQFARSRGILCQGRGSAANSAVCYCLGITEVDPQHGNSLFERFISRERNEPPDIDVDFEHQRREEVIQYIYARYGHDCAALTAVVITYRPRSALRDVGKALGISSALIDHVAKSHAWWEGGNAIEDVLKRAEVGIDEPVMRQWLYLAQAVIGSPRHLSQHPGGFVLTREPLWSLVPIEPASMPERRVVQWDKDDLDTIGLMKVDVLALGMLTAIGRALTMTAQRRGLRSFEIQDIARHDQATFEMISRADTMGVFQIESRAQMSMLPVLKPRVFYDLVIEVAIVRPGPIQGGMVHPYLRRRQGLEPVTYPSRAVKSVLERTLGVPIFQEQVMKIAMVAAGFSAGEADSLRRAMAAWKKKGGMNVFQERLTTGLAANGYEPAFAQAIVKQIEGFGEYGFPESHAASFAWLAYVSAWLKCHEPEAFLAALLNAQPMGFYSPSQLIQDSRRHGVTVLPIDVQCSHWDCSLEPLETLSKSSQQRPAVRLGFNQIKGLSQGIAQRITAARSAGPFTSIKDLARRAHLSTTILGQLAGAASLGRLSEHRRDALWQSATAVVPNDLLRDAIDEAALPEAVGTPSELENTCTDYAYLGYTLGQHPLALLRPALQAQRYTRFDGLNGKRQGQIVRACGLVTQRQRPSTAKGVMFVTLEDETGNLNVIVYPGLIERWRQVLLRGVLLGVVGTWQSHSGVQHLLAGRLVDETRRLDDVFKTTSP